jgi:phage shock protein A
MGASEGIYIVEVQIMRLLDRVSILLRANLNDLMDRAEDPEKMIKQLLIEMNSQLIQVKTQVAAAIAGERRLEKLWHENEARAKDWRRRAELAIQSDDDDLAKQALARHNSYNELTEEFRVQYEQQAAQREELKEALHQLEAKVQAAEAKKDLLIVRSRQAKAKLSIRETVAGVNHTSAISHFERMEAKVEEEEFQAQAYVELDKDTIEAKFHQLEQEDALERQLHDLKEQVLEESR